MSMDCLLSGDSLSSKTLPRNPDQSLIKHFLIKPKRTIKKTFFFTNFRKPKIFEPT